MIADHAFTCGLSQYLRVTSELFQLINDTIVLGLLNFLSSLSICHTRASIRHLRIDAGNHWVSEWSGFGYKIFIKALLWDFIIHQLLGDGVLKVTINFVNSLSGFTKVPSHCVTRALRKRNARAPRLTNSLFKLRNTLKSIAEFSRDCILEFLFWQYDIQWCRDRILRWHGPLRREPCRRRFDVSRLNGRCREGTCTDRRRRGLLSFADGRRSNAWLFSRRRFTWNDLAVLIDRLLAVDVDHRAALGLSAQRTCDHICAEWLVVNLLLTINVDDSPVLPGRCISVRRHIDTTLRLLLRLRRRCARYQLRAGPCATTNDATKDGAFQRTL